MTVPNHWLLRREIDAIADAVRSLETLMMGYHFTGGCADEIAVLAKRLTDLARPDNGHLAVLKKEELRDASA